VALTVPTTNPALSDKPTAAAQSRSKLCSQNYAGLGKVAPRNSLLVINAVFNDRNGWDGPANHGFHGNNPFGKRDADFWLLGRSAMQPSGRSGSKATDTVESRRSA
jgi:hypothetical protein